VLLLLCLTKPGVCHHRVLGVSRAVAMSRYKNPFDIDSSDDDEGDHRGSGSAAVSQAPVGQLNTSTRRDHLVDDTSAKSNVGHEALHVSQTHVRHADEGNEREDCVKAATEADKHDERQRLPQPPRAPLVPTVLSPVQRVPPVPHEAELPPRAANEHDGVPPRASVTVSSAAHEAEPRAAQGGVGVSGDAAHGGRWGNGAGEAHGSRAVAPAAALPLPTPPQHVQHAHPTVASERRAEAEHGEPISALARSGSSGATLLPARNSDDDGGLNATQRAERAASAAVTAAAPTIASPKRDQVVYADDYLWDATDVLHEREYIAGGAAAGAGGNPPPPESSMTHSQRANARGKKAKKRNKQSSRVDGQPSRGTTLCYTCGMRGDHLAHQCKEVWTKMQKEGLTVKVDPPPAKYVCAKCNEHGHWIKYCAASARPPPKGDYVCNICNLPGHWRQFCELKPKEKHKTGYVCKLCGIPGHPIADCSLAVKSKRTDGASTGAAAGAPLSSSSLAATADNKGNDDRPPPASYVCRLCNTPGHWIKDCARASDRKRKGNAADIGNSADNPDAAPKRGKIVRAECKFWLRGACRNGAGCSFSHTTIPDLSETVCRYHVTGHCMKGETCPFSHDLSLLPCIYHHGVEGRCGKGASCPFSHDVLTDRQRTCVCDTPPSLPCRSRTHDPSLTLGTPM
jgi:hypothetical protein